MYLYGKLKNQEERQLLLGSVVSANGGSVTVISGSETETPRLIAVGGQVPEYSAGDIVLTAEIGGALYVIGRVI